MAGVAGRLAAVLLAYLRQAANVLGEAGVVVIQALTWIVAAGIASATFAYIYRYGPDRWKAKWRWLSIGSIAATMLWLAATVRSEERRVGKGVSVRVDLGGGRIIKKKKKTKN